MFATSMLSCADIPSSAWARVQLPEPPQVSMTPHAGSDDAMDGAGPIGELASATISAKLLANWFHKKSIVSAASKTMTLKSVLWHSIFTTSMSNKAATFRNLSHRSRLVLILRLRRCPAPHPDVAAVRHEPQPMVSAAILTKAKNSPRLTVWRGPVSGPLMVA